MARAKKQAQPADVYNPNTEGKKTKTSAPSGNTVVVALCHPHGIAFDLGQGRKVTLNGNASNLRGLPMGELPLGGFGLTEIAKDEWEAIKKIVADWPLFKNGLLYANDKRADVLAEADEKAELRHGREPIVVEGDGKQSKSEPAAAALA